MQKLATSYCIHDDSYYLTEAITSFRTTGEVFVFVSRVPWHDHPGDWQAAASVARAAGAEVIIGEWTSELAHRQAALGWLAEHGYTHALIPDGDEIIEPQLLQTLLKIAEMELADRVYVHWDTYWKTPEYVVRPREAFTPLILLDLRKAHPVGLRNFEGGRGLLLTPEHGILHHLSYVGPDARLLELELAEHPNPPFVLLCLGMSDHYEGEKEGAVRWLRNCVEVSGNGVSHVRKTHAMLPSA